ncbi:MAG: hypothetical protein Q8830_03360, partial [Candidatus Phytoplasma australasiaticum]|nr:hypothetical protein [Candidatus Phytoplasma australasiaticum]
QQINNILNNFQDIDVNHLLKEITEIHSKITTIQRKKNITVVNFFHDIWISSSKPIRSYILSPLQQVEANYTIADLFQNDKWNLDKFSLDLPQDLTAIFLDHPMNAYTVKEDKRTWDLTSNGYLTYSTTYNHIIGFTENNNQTPFRFQIIWKNNVPNKVKIFMWTMLHGRLLTNHHFHRRGIQVNPKCKLCDHPTEDTFHVFFKCNIA